MPLDTPDGEPGQPVSAAAGFLKRKKGNFCNKIHFFGNFGTILIMIIDIVFIEINAE
jgi:hypothetical protein